FKKLILRLLQNNALLQHIKETNLVHEETLNNKDSVRRTSSIQLSVQPSASSIQNDDDDDRTSSGDCCKFA
ncbi:unnamed protein product, partial [Adineta steineri]